MNSQPVSAFRELAAEPVLASARRLQTNRSFRDATRSFFIEGVRNFVSAFDRRFEFETLLYSEKLLTAPVVRKMVRRLKGAGFPFVRLAPAQFRAISSTERASGVAAILRQQFTPLDLLVPCSSPCWTVLSNVRAPGNLGTLIRTSAAAGAGGFILLGGRVDPYDPAVVRAAMGALFSQSIVRTSPAAFGHWIRLHGYQVIGASPGAPTDFTEIAYRRPTFLMLGDERKGLSAEELGLCETTAKIPMMPGIDSLNIAVAGSLMLYHAVRGLMRGEIAGTS